MTTLQRVGRLGAKVPAGLRELLLIVALFVAYKLGRLITAGDVGDAFANALDVVRLEQALRLPDEAALQGWVMGAPDLIEAANHYYAWVHFPLTALALLWVWWRDREAYRWLRRALVGLTVFGLAVNTLIPLAPPRMLPELGFVDTALIFGDSVYASSLGSSLSNQYAAMPSLHVGWALWVALVAVCVLRTRWRWLAVLHPIITVAVVVVTANHFWIDGLVSAAALALIVPLARHTRGVGAHVAQVAQVAHVMPQPRRPVPLEAGSHLHAHGGARDADR
jgi:hypothetical protein